MNGKFFLKKLKKYLHYSFDHDIIIHGSLVKGSIPVRTAKYLKPVHSWKHDVPAFSLYIFI